MWSKVTIYNCLNVLTSFNAEERALIPRELAKILQKRGYGHIEEKAKHILALQKFIKSL